MTTQLSKMIFTSALGVVLALGVSFKAQAQLSNGFVDRNGLLSVSGIDTIVDLGEGEDLIGVGSDLNGGSISDLISVGSGGDIILPPVEIDPDLEVQSDLIGGEIPTVIAQSVPEPSATLALFFLTGLGLLVTRKHLS